MVDQPSLKIFGQYFHRLRNFAQVFSLGLWFIHLEDVVVSDGERGMGVI